MTEPMTDAAAAAETIVDLVRKYTWTPESEFALYDSEVREISGVMTVAGFDSFELVHSRIQCGTMEVPRVLNDVCPYKVVDVSDKRDLNSATGWLNQMIKFIQAKFNDEHIGRPEVLAHVLVEIRRSVPLPPIRMNVIGDELIEPSPMIKWNNFFVEHSKDESEIPMGPIGAHRFCGGLLNRHRATQALDSVSCVRCNVRSVFSSQVRTYGDLRVALGCNPPPKV